jgi:phage FluMu protein Com
MAPGCSSCACGPMRDDPDEAAKELRRIIEAHMTLAKHAAHGHTHIEMHCPSCGKTALMPFRLMSPDQLNLTLADYERQLRCDKCGMMLETVTPWRED